MGDQRSDQTNSLESSRQQSAAPASKPPLVSQGHAPPLLQLQRQLGNRAVTHLIQTNLIQAKLSVSQPNDHYEQEADRVSDKVMQMPDPALTMNPKIQRSPLGGYSFGKLAITPKERLGIQTKLEIGQPGDRYEQEADRVADQVMSMPDPTASSVQQMVGDDKLEGIQTQSLATSITPLLQREAMPEEEKEKIQTKPSLQLAPDGNREAEGNLEDRLNNSKGGGSPLPDDVRSFMEPRFGADFSKVRVHTGGEAVQMNRELNAQAFTHKQDVYFGAGKSPGKDALTAHELTHVVQQGAAKLQRKPKLGQSESSSVLHHLQTKQQQPGFNASLYRKEIAEFQKAHSAEQIMAKQEQILRQPEEVNVRERDSSQTLRRCGDKPTPTPAVAPLSFSSASFSAGTGGPITATPSVASLAISSAAYNPSGSVKVSGGTDAEAQDWEVGFLQTLKSTTRTGHYTGSPTTTKYSIVVPTPIRDGNPVQSTSTPWYDSLNPDAKKAFTKTNYSESVSLWDKPGTGAPWGTPDGKGKLDNHDGKDIFTAWMIVRKKTSPNTINYINWTSWEVDWGVTTNYASKGTKTVDTITGATKNTGSGAGQGADTPVLSGAFPNTAATPTWS